MARTAPVPNIPPIPGMCPSIAVMGGGGGSGGGSGNGAGDGSGDGAGSGDGSGDNAQGDGRGAASCGTGGTGSCTNCGHNVSRGDPVDVVSGAVETLPEVDLMLLGFTHLKFVRTYSTKARRRDVGLGFGWGHTLSWRLEVGRDKIRVHRPTGQTVDFELLEAAGASTMSRGGWILRREADGFELDAMDGFFHRFEATSDPYVFRLRHVADNAKNQILCRYARDVLAEIVDTAGRRIRLSPDARGRATELSVFDEQANQWAPFARYSYDDAGDLVAVMKPSGGTHTYSYSDHALTSHTDAEGLTFHFVYDSAGRCRETWGDYADGRDLGLAASVSETLADGHTQAKGLLHCVFEWGKDGYSEVVDSVCVQRFFGNAFGTIDKAVSGGATTSHVHDERGHVVRHVDALGAVTTLERDERGRLLRETNALGQSMTIRRDAKGNVVEMIDALGNRTRGEYDYERNLVLLEEPGGALTKYEWSRGVMTAMVDARGARTTFRYNSQGLAEEIHQPNGGVWRYRYNGLGRCTEVVDPQGLVTKYLYDNAYRIAAIVDANGQTTHTFDREDKLTKVVHPNGASSTFTWGGFRSLLAVEKSSGERIGYRYNREGWLLEVKNGAGEVHTLTWNARKDLVEERTFDGRGLRFRYDAMNRVTGYDPGNGKWIELVRDPLGQVTEQSYPDGTTLAIEHDPRGRIVSAKAPESLVTLARDARGEVVRETQTIGERTFWVERALDHGQQVTSVTTSLGHNKRVRRDGWGSPARAELDDLELSFEVDSQGRETRRVLPGGAAITSEYEPTGALARRAVWSAQAAAHTRPDEPAYLGGHAAGLTYDRRYRYNTVEDLLGWSDLSKRDRQFDVDAAGRVIRVEGRGGVLESFRYDATGNLFEGPPKGVDRGYGAGGRLERVGTTRYRWDESGHLAEKVPDDPAKEPTRYHWNDRGLLAAVDLPGGRRVELLYDAFARRTRKRVLSTASGQPRVERTVYFVWDGTRLLEELHVVPGRPEWRRTFAYDDDGAPMGHRAGPLTTPTDDIAPRSEWLFYATDGIGAPAALVKGDGSVASEIEQRLYGAGAERPTPLLFPGQYLDEETGLANNQCRYYDPADGRYISADPIGLLGALNPFAYVPNPLTLSDPLGLRARRPPHEVGNVSLTFNDGPTVTPRGAHASHTSSASGLPTNFYSGYTEDSRYPGRADSHCAGLSAGEAYWESHTERKSMRWAEQEARRNRRSLRGAHLEMTGQRAPCNTCNAEMERWTREPPDGTGANVTYNWPTNNSRSYSGGSSTGSVRRPYVDS